MQTYAGLPGQDPPVAVRSLATAEDLPEASFAGQQETYLNVRGANGVLEAVKMYLKGQSANPYERQRALAARREEAIQTTSRRNTV